MERMAKEVSMNTKILFVLLVTTFMNNTLLAQESQRHWFDRISKIEPGLSKRQQVESVFGAIRVEKTNSFEDTEDVYYKTNEGALRVTYSLGGCSRLANSYDLERDTVVSFLFRAVKPIPSSKVKLDLKVMKRERESDTTNVYYSNSEAGVVYVLFKSKVFEIQHGLTERQKLKLSRRSN
jgi:hypothetical protein